MTVVAIKQKSTEKPQQDDPARGRLAGAIEAKRKCDKVVDGIAAKLEAATSLRRSVQEKLEAATQAMTVARAADEEATASSGTAVTVSIKKQRAAITELEDQLAVSEGAIGRFEGQLADKIREQARAAEDVVACRNVVVEPIVHKLAARMDSLRRESIVAQTIMSELANVLHPHTAAYKAAAEARNMQRRTAADQEASEAAAERVEADLAALLEDPEIAIEIPT